MSEKRDETARKSLRQGTARGVGGVGPVALEPGPAVDPSPGPAVDVSPGPPSLAAQALQRWRVGAVGQASLLI